MKITTAHTVKMPMAIGTNGTGRASRSSNLIHSSAAMGFRVTSAFLTLDLALIRPHVRDEGPRNPYRFSFASERRQLYHVQMTITTDNSRKVSVTGGGGVVFRTHKRTLEKHRQMTLPELTHALRLRAKMTQTKFSTALGLSRGAVAQYEGGTARPSMLVLENMAKLSGLKLEDLLVMPTVEQAQNRAAQNIEAHANLDICLNLPSVRDSVINTLALLAGRQKSRK